ncbi:hypothetical protein [uncultured Microbacterium sp.]|uniref:hypothetical protein n=1 Tax=uncultured Microbacterium sp. TaxID=191216 RepID=UPI0025932069|nr:hypothetical protein [uncultured Microbacterium sp.]
MHDPDLLPDLSDLFEAGVQAAPDPAARAARRRRVRRALLTVAIVVTVIAASIVGYVAWALNATSPTCRMRRSPRCPPAAP